MPSDAQLFTSISFVFRKMKGNYLDFMTVVAMLFPLAKATGICSLCREGLPMPAFTQLALCELDLVFQDTSKDCTTTELLVKKQNTVADKRASKAAATASSAATVALAAGSNDGANASRGDGRKGNVLVMADSVGTESVSKARPVLWQYLQDLAADSRRLDPSAPVEAYQQLCLYGVITCKVRIDTKTGSVVVHRMSVLRQAILNLHSNNRTRVLARGPSDAVSESSGMQEVPRHWLWQQ